MPSPQQYDSNFAFVVKKNPVWSIIPEHSASSRKKPENIEQEVSLRESTRDSSVNQLVE